ncbi:hypothetical protein J7L68_03560 [bacterium]|nr:hypothetical protein [bacterium]
MAKIIDIGLYHSLEKPPAQMRATSMRKIYTSLLIVLLIIAGGIALFFYFSSTERANAITEIPTKPKTKPITLSGQIARNLIEWDKFINAILPLNPQKVVSDGADNFICVFKIKSSMHPDSLILKVDKLGKIITIIDTSTIDGKFNVVFKGRMARVNTQFQPQPIKKFLLTTVMNFIDSLAEMHGLTDINRLVVSANEKVKGGNKFRYRLTAKGSYQQFMAFARKIKELKYAIAPVSYVIEMDSTRANFDIVWGLYDFNPPADDTTKVASKKKK